MSLNRLLTKFYIGPRNQRPQFCCRRRHDDAYDVRCPLHLGDEQRLFQSFNRLSLLRSRWVNLVRRFNGQYDIDEDCYYSSRQIIDDFREAYYWLWQNTRDDARIMSWWDYGYQIAGMGNRTTLVDNNTWNNSHIALVRLIFQFKRDLRTV